MTSSPYSLAVAYRIYPKVSKIPFLHPDNKMALAEVGVRTFKRSLGQTKAKVFFLLDNCPPEYEQMILKYFTKEDIEFVHYPGIGNLPTFGKQIDLLLNQNFAEKVYFAEDDYVYRDNAMEAAISMLDQKDAHFVTPYDHLDSYIMPIHTSHKYEITIHGGFHWRTSASTCLTFLTTKTILRKTESAFRSYCHGNWDSCLWFAITKFNILNIGTLVKYLFTDRFIAKILILSWLKTGSTILFGKKYKLWQPMPSVATHMEKISLAPNIDWDKVAFPKEQAQV